MKVLVVASDGFGGRGGIAQYTRDMLAALCAHPAKPRVVAFPRVMPLRPEPLPSGLHWDARSVGSNWNYSRVVAAAAFQQRQADLILCTHIHLLPVAFLLRAVSKAPVALFIYGFEVSQPTHRRLANRLASGVDAIISIREYSTTRFRRWAPVERIPTYVLHNPIHLEWYGAGPKPPELIRRYELEGKTILLTMGRVEESNKGFDEVIEVMPRLIQAIPNVAYVIGGDGYDTPRLREKARSLGIEDRIVFTGHVHEHEKADHYRLADAYVMAGRSVEFDRYPLRFVFLEAMASGIPVIGARPEVHDEARNEGALLTRQVDPFSPDELVEAVVETLRGPRGVPAALARFAFPAFQSRLHAIVDDLLQLPAKRPVPRWPQASDHG